jgi:hypothetical protein
VDGDERTPVTPDTFRIKIWDKADDTVVYDNKLGASDDGYDGTELGGGNIKVHKKSGGALAATPGTWALRPGVVNRWGAAALSW